MKCKEQNKAEVTLTTKLANRETHKANKHDLPKVTSKLGKELRTVAMTLAM